MEGACNTCKKASSELKRCSKCSTTLYYSKDCQKADWKEHKKTCRKSAIDPVPADTLLSPPKGLEQPIVKPFSRLDNNTYLHDRPEKDVYRSPCLRSSFILDLCAVGLLIDCYRLRLEDDYKLDGDAAADSIYGGAESSLPGFRKFLRRAASRPGLLPSWWNAEKQKLCERLAVDSSQWCDLGCAVEKSDIIEHYGDARFPMQLRMLGQVVIGRGPGGDDGTHMRSVMVMMENGGYGGGLSTVTATVDMQSGKASSVHA
ncbi:putative MYND domain protein [Astrocystis sublimbata]|nr:putative MYND domain protein [Astrocystis sublimbata]